MIVIRTPSIPRGVGGGVGATFSSLGIVLCLLCINLLAWIQLLHVRSFFFKTKLNSHYELFSEISNVFDLFNDFDILLSIPVSKKNRLRSTENFQTTHSPNENSTLHVFNLRIKITENRHRTFLISRIISRTLSWKMFWIRLCTYYISEKFFSMYPIFYRVGWYFFLGGCTCYLCPSLEEDDNFAPIWPTLLSKITKNNSSEKFCSRIVYL